ncbi:hypothetical protein BFP72_06125 [Reichenbachiella sp. 5M10]|uniref:AHH domain-containing protein n=1 Tax=Reichenbachiella sp. 5M10 TaxID=1889772 RepID=UPI000C15ED47|nr:AHH domain-containing protein [Reichenbachiella sp. 5M10]PIB34998.1 hypothetical protein BFP72_06125 [Reichenbachiella sp. 5M10]
MGTEIAYVDPVEELEHETESLRQKYIHAAFLSDDQRKALRHVAERAHNDASLSYSYDQVLSEIQDFHRRKHAPAPGMVPKDGSSNTTETEAKVAADHPSTPVTQDEKAPKVSQGDGFAKLQEINRRRKAKEAFEKGIIKYYKGVKTTYLNACLNRREKEGTRAKFKRFESNVVRNGLGWGSSAFVSALKAQFPQILWAAEIQHFDQPEVAAVREDPAAASTTPVPPSTSAVPPTSDTVDARPTPQAPDSKSQEENQEESQEESEKEDKGQKETDTKKANADTSEGVLQAYIQKRPTEQIDAAASLADQVKTKLHEESTKAKEEIPTVDQVPTGLASSESKPVKRPPLGENKIPDLAPTGETVKGDTLMSPTPRPDGDSAQSAEAIQAAKPPFEPAPTLPLQGATDPEQLGDFAQQSKTATQKAAQAADHRTQAHTGLDRIAPAPSTKGLEPQAKDVAEVEINPIAIDPIQTKVPEIEDQLNAQASLAMTEKLAAEEAKLTEASSTLETQKTEAKVDFEQKMANEVAQTTAKQKAAQQKAKADTESHQAAWQAENKQLVNEFDTQQAASRAQAQSQIEEQVAQTNQQTAAKMSQAQSEANKAVATAKSEATAKQKKAEEDKSWFDKAADYVSSVWENLKSAISNIFNALVTLVNGIIDAAKTAIAGLIDMATQLIVGFIKTFGEILKAAIKVLFAAFPRIAKKFETLIDAAINLAVQAVQKLADLLKAAIQALLDFVATVIVAYIQAYQAIVNMVLSAIEAIAKVLKAALQGITHLVLSAQQSPSQFWGQLSEELLGQDVTRPLPNEIIPPAVETAPSTNELKDLIASSPVSANDASILHKTSYEAGDFSVEPSPSEVTLDGGLMRDLSLLGDGTHEFGHNDQDIQGLKADALQQDDTTAEVTETTSVDTQSVSPDLVGPFHTPGERATFLIGQMKDGVMKWLGENKVAILAGLIAGITGVILANILTGGAIMAALPLIMQLMSAYFAAELVYQVAKRLGSYLSSAWPGNLVEGAKHLARAFVILAIELLMALLFGAKGAMKAAKGAAKTAKGGRKSAQQAVKAGAKQYIKNQKQAARKLAAVSQGGAQAAIKNGKFVMKGVKKSTLKGAKSIDDLTQKLMKQLRFKKFRFTLKQRRFKLEGQVNPWVLLASGEVKEVNIKKGDRIGDHGTFKTKPEYAQRQKGRKRQRTDSEEVEGYLIGKRDNPTPSAYVQSLQADDMTDAARKVEYNNIEADGRNHIVGRDAFDYEKAVKELGLAPANAIKNRSKLAANLGMPPGTNYNAHHIIPIELIAKSKALRIAINNGFDFNSKLNGKWLKRYSSSVKRNKAGDMIADTSGTHASHPKYSDEVLLELDNIDISASPEKIKEEIIEVIKYFDEMIENNNSTRLNELFQNS